MPGPPRKLRPRGTLQYDKAPLSLDKLVDRLSERGLVIPDPDRASRYLRHIGYFRLSPYAIPFQQGKPDHLFRDGTAFDDVLDIYIFDRALRLLVMDALERVEVAVRAALTDHMSTTYKDPHWYIDPSYFRDRDKHTGLLRIVRNTSENRLLSAPELVGQSSGSADDELKMSDRAVAHRSALEHYLLTYGTPELPPSWLMVESLTIGQLDSVISNLRQRSDRGAVAACIGLSEPVLLSWMRTYVRVTSARTMVACGTLASASTRPSRARVRSLGCSVTTPSLRAQQSASTRCSCHFRRCLTWCHREAPGRSASMIS